MKAQEIRLIDVFILSPLMIRSGWLNRNKDPITSYLMIFAGAATAAYNWKNYKEIREAKKRSV